MTNVFSDYTQVYFESTELDKKKPIMGFNCIGWEK